MLVKDRLLKVVVTAAPILKLCASYFAFRTGRSSAVASVIRATSLPS